MLCILTLLNEHDTFQQDAMKDPLAESESELPRLAYIHKPTPRAFEFYQGKATITAAPQAHHEDTETSLASRLVAAVTAFEGF